jgi:outer membrane lipoprotein-sorting protein
MKKTIFVIGLVFLAFLAGCAGAGGSPKSVVQKFYKAIEENDSKALAEVATSDTAQLIAMFGTKVQGMVKENGKIKTMTESINGDTATVKVTFENGEEEDIDLVKVDGKWKVTISK